MTHNLGDSAVRFSIHHQGSNGSDNQKHHHLSPLETALSVVTNDNTGNVDKSGRRRQHAPTMHVVEPTESKGSSTTDVCAGDNNGASVMHEKAGIASKAPPLLPRVSTREPIDLLTSAPSSAVPKAGTPAAAVYTDTFDLGLVAEIYSATPSYSIGHEDDAEARAAADQAVNGAAVRLRSSEPRSSNSVIGGSRGGVEGTLASSPPGALNGESAAVLPATAELAGLMEIRMEKARYGLQEQQHGAQSHRVWEQELLPSSRWSFDAPTTVTTSSSMRSLSADLDWPEAFDADSDSESGDGVTRSSSGSDSEDAADSAMFLARFRQQQQQQQLYHQPFATSSAATPRLRDPSGARPPLRKPTSSTSSDSFLAPSRSLLAGRVWKMLSPMHRAFIDRWRGAGADRSNNVFGVGIAAGDERGCVTRDARGLGKDEGKDGPSPEGRRFIEEWLHAGNDSSRLCIERLRRLANARAAWGWPEVSLLARDVADALLTGAVKLLPSGSRSPGSPHSTPPPPSILLIHTRLIDHERCPPEQYDRGLSYLLQILSGGNGVGRSRTDGVDEAAELMVVIDAQKDTVGAKVKRIIGLLIGTPGGGGSGGGGDESGWGGGAAGSEISRRGRDSFASKGSKSPGAETEGGVEKQGHEGGRSGGGRGWDGMANVVGRGTAAAATASSGQMLPLCDPALSVRPLRIQKVVILHAGAVLKAVLLPRRVSLGGTVSPSVSSVNSSSGGVTVRHGSCSPRASLVSRSFLAVSGGASREWLKQEIGDEVAAGLPKELGGDLDLEAWGWEGWVGRRIQREDLVETSMTADVAESPFAPAMSRYLDVCHSLAESNGTQEYSRILSESLRNNLAVPVAWVKRTLCDVVQAGEAHQPPWRATVGAGVGGGNGLNREWAQLWKDMGRDVVEIRGEMIDPGSDEGESGGVGASGGGDPELVLAPLAREIGRVGIQGGLVGLSEVQCYLAARDILLSTKRTSSGGDVWVCVDRLCCARPGIAVVCPASNEADPLHIVAEFEHSEEQRQQQQQQQHHPESRHLRSLNKSQAQLQSELETLRGRIATNPGEEELSATVGGNRASDGTTAGSMKGFCGVEDRDFSAVGYDRIDELAGRRGVAREGRRYQTGSSIATDTGGGDPGGNIIKNPNNTAGRHDCMPAKALGSTWNGTASTARQNVAASCVNDASTAVGMRRLSQTLPEGSVRSRRQSDPLGAFPCASAMSTFHPRVGQHYHDHGNLGTRGPEIATPRADFRDGDEDEYIRESEARNGGVETQIDGLGGRNGSSGAAANGFANEEGVAKGKQVEGGAMEDWIEDDGASCGSSVGDRDTMEECDFDVVVGGGLARISRKERRRSYSDSGIKEMLKGAKTVAEEDADQQQQQQRRTSLSPHRTTTTTITTTTTPATHIAHHRRPPPLPPRPNTASLSSQSVREAHTTDNHLLKVTGEDCPQYPNDKNNGNPTSQALPERIGNNMPKDGLDDGRCLREISRKIAAGATEENQSSSIHPPDESATSAISPAADCDPTPFHGSVVNDDRLGDLVPMISPSSSARQQSRRPDASADDNHRRRRRPRAGRRSSHGSYGQQSTPFRDLEAAVTDVGGGVVGAEGGRRESRVIEGGMVGGGRHASFVSVSGASGGRGGWGTRGGAEVMSGTGCGDDGCVLVTVTTSMEYKICNANPSSEDDAVMQVISGVFERVFRVRASGAAQGLQPTDDSPIVRLTLKR